jgi:hypothetical protein
MYPNFFWNYPIMFRMTHSWETTIRLWTLVYQRLYQNDWSRVLWQKKTRPKYTVYLNALKFSDLSGRGRTILGVLTGPRWSIMEHQVHVRAQNAATHPMRHAQRAPGIALKCWFLRWVSSGTHQRHTKTSLRDAQTMGLSTLGTLGTDYIFWVSKMFKSIWARLHKNSAQNDP